MVRPAPIVRIDFGNGHVVTRTLHGNIAGHVCAADGQVVDILPGMYTPAAYAAALGQIVSVADSVREPAEQRQGRLREYHREKARTLRARPDRIAYPRATAVEPPNAALRQADPTKRTIEMRVEMIVVQAPASDNPP